MRYLARLWWKRNSYRVLVVNFEGKRRLKKYWSRWENKTKMELRECVGTVWTGVIWLRIGTSNKPM
jgi:hypothetical protein